MRGHLYCSTQCARDSGLHPVWRRAADTLGIEVPSRLALLCVALIGAAPVVLALRAVGELDRLNEPSPFATPRRGTRPASTRSPRPRREPRSWDAPRPEPLSFCLPEGSSQAR